MPPSSDPPIDWHLPPEMITLRRGQIDVWILELNKTPCRPDYLDANETTRLHNFRYPIGQRRYCASHTALRTILGHYLNCPPRMVSLTTADAGKPCIDSKPPPLYFNMSHADNTALLAVRIEHEIGIDFENLRNMANIDRIAQRVFRQNEIKQLQQTEWDMPTFFELWTRMEARQKCLGRGVFGPPVDEKQVKTTPLTLNTDQYAAIAWPIEGEPEIMNLYQG